MVAATLGAIVACTIGGALLLVDTDTVKRAVERHVEQSVGGEVVYESAALNLFPHPRVKFSGVTVGVPGLVSGRIAALHVRIAWLPLLYGEVRLEAVRFERPGLEVQIAPGENADPFAAYRAALGPITDALTRYAAGTSITIERGEVAVVYGGRRFVSLSELEVAAGISAEAINAKVSAAAGLWRAARGEISITRGSLAASANLQVSGLRAAQILDAYGRHDALRVRLDSADLTLRRGDRRPQLDSGFHHGLGAASGPRACRAHGRSGRGAYHAGREP